MPERSSNIANPNDNYKFTGHERDDEASLTLDYMGARFYDPIIGRFMSIDPLGRKFPSYSPYNYTLNNPINMWDPDGRAPVKCPPVCGAGVIKLSSFSRTAGFALSEPVIAYNIGSYKSGRTNITTNAVRFSTRGPRDGDSILNFAPNNEGGEVNAFRHALWIGTIAAEYGDARAARVGNAHEENPWANINQRTFESRLDADGVVDLLNNEIGRDIGAMFHDSDMKGIAMQVLETFANEGLWTVTENENGFTISRTKITQEQYDQLSKIFKELDENGMREDEKN